jgi:hypothetical protein
MLRGSSDRRFFLIVFGPLLGVYLFTATWSLPVNKDTFTNALFGWNVANHGSVYLEDHAAFADLQTWGWLVPARDSVTSQYPPGAAILSVPFYAVWPAEAEAFPVFDDSGAAVLTDSGAPVVGLIPPLAPATLVAALTTAAAMGLLALVFRRLDVGDPAALMAAYVGGLATAAWPVASDQLWQHGPNMAWIALALLLSEHRAVASGFAYGAAILTRPPLALIPAAVGFYRAWATRSPRPLAVVGLGAAAGLAAFVGYNWWVFGDPALSAGYGPSFQSNVLSGGGSSGLGSSYPVNLLGAAFSSGRGLFVFSPFLLILLPGLRAGWRETPAWARGAAVGGLLYLLLQYKANRYSGGVNYTTYRYPLEALVAAGPLLLYSYTSWVAKKASRVTLFVTAVAVSVVIHGLAAVDLPPF